MKKRAQAAAQYAFMRDRPMSIADFAPEEEPPGVFAPESIEGPKIYDALRQASLTPKGAPSVTAAVAEELIGGPVAHTVGKVVKAAPLVGAATEGLGSMAGRAKELVKGALKSNADEVVEGAATAGVKKADEAKVGEIQYYDPDAADFADDYDAAAALVAKQEEGAAALARKVDMGITRDRELHSTVSDSKGDVVGAAWRSFDGEEYAFDVAIDPAYQGKGLGSKLTDDMIGAFDEYQMLGPDAVMRLHVTSPKMEEMLKRRGFTVLESFARGDKIMGKK